MFMIAIVVKKNRFKREQKKVVQRIAELREELEDLIDYLDLLKARPQNLGNPRLSTEQVRRMLKLN